MQTIDSRPETAPRTHAGTAAGLLRFALFTLALCASGLGLVSCAGSPTDTEFDTRVVHDLLDEAGWIESEQLLPADDGEPLPGYRVDEERRRLILRRGQRVRFYLRIPADSWLVVDRWELRSGSQLLPAFVLERDGGEETQLRPEPAKDGKPVRFPLSAPGGEIARLTLGAPDTGKEGDGLILWEPRIETLADAGSTEAAEDAEGSSAEAAGSEPKDNERPHLFIYLVDTLRKDHLGVYGYDRDISPRLDEFAEKATVYENAYAQSTWTRPAVASVLTGLEPQIHGVNEREDALPDGVRTLAEILKDDGYHTGAFITNGNVSDEYNFDQGFDVFSRSRKLRYFSHQLNERIFGYLDETPLEGPLFAYVHAVDPHGPYTPFEPYLQRFAADVADVSVGANEYLNEYRRKRKEPSEQLVRDALDLYAAEVAYNDEHFGKFLDYLKENGLYDNAWIAFTADHGEEFWEHGDWSHGQGLFGEQLDIPLVIKAPHQTEGRRSAVRAQHIDLFASALDYAGSTASIRFRGRSLRNPNLPETPPRGIFSMVKVDTKEATSVIDGRWKLIDPKTPNLGLGREPLLFDLETDPGELNDLADERPVVYGYMNRLRRQHEADEALFIAPKQEEMSEELIRELKALGYID